MPYRDLSFQEVVCCPDTEEKLSIADDWLYSCGEALYPVLCNTPVLHPNINRFLKSETWNIARAFAEMEEEQDVRSWFYSRYGFFNHSDPIPIDTEVLGEGYPGFWEAIETPDFLSQLDFQTPESLVMDIVEDRHFPLGLDLGCGQGGMMQMMAENCRKVYGLESNFYLAATANRLLQSEEIPIRYFVPESGPRTSILEKKALNNAQAICGDVRALPFCEPLFDWVHCGHILDLVDDPARILIEIKRIMKPGGVLSICTPWDFTDEGHFDGLLELLHNDFSLLRHEDGIPWLRFNHKRRFVLHEDWIWVGKLDI